MDKKSKKSVDDPSQVLADILQKHLGQFSSLERQYRIANAQNRIREVGNANKFHFEEPHPILSALD